MIATNYQAAFLCLLISIGFCDDDSPAFWIGRLVSSLKSAQACIADGTRRTQAGSIGGQLATWSAKVPAFFAAAIFSGTAQRETYQLKRGESAGSLATARTQRIKSRASFCFGEVML